MKQIYIKERGHVAMDGKSEKDKKKDDGDIEWDLEEMKKAIIDSVDDCDKLMGG